VGVDKILSFENKRFKTKSAEERCSNFRNLDIFIFKFLLICQKKVSFNMSTIGLIMWLIFGEGERRRQTLMERIQFPFIGLKLKTYINFYFFYQSSVPFSFEKVSNVIVEFSFLIFRNSQPLYIFFFSQTLVPSSFSNTQFFLCQTH
jgi:hypothetical protein